MKPGALASHVVTVVMETHPKRLTTITLALLVLGWICELGKILTLWR